MIVQWLLDFLRDVIVAWIRGIPQPPAVIWDWRNWFVTSGAQLNELVSKFGIVIPWETFGTLVAMWLGVLAFWLLMLVIRIVLWALGR